MPKPNDAQLEAAAGGVAYRCDQLGGIALMLGRQMRVDLAPHLPLATVRLVANALVESALVHARSPAYFLTSPKTDEVAAKHYGATVPTNLVTLARTRMFAPISDHLAHSKYADIRAADDLIHPGSWPITELALILVGGVADVVAELDSSSASWFTPAPSEILRLLHRDRGTRRTTRSRNPDVQRLTTALQNYLDPHRSPIERGSFEG